MPDPEFRRDLYRGTARDYDRFRVAYPQSLIDDLAGRSGADGRIPAGYEQDRRERPDRTVLADAGFQVLGDRVFPTKHAWTVETLTGLLFSTAVLSRGALAGHADDLAADLRRELGGSESAGGLPETNRIRL